MGVSWIKGDRKFSREARLASLIPMKVNTERQVARSRRRNTNYKGEGAHVSQASQLYTAENYNEFYDSIPMVWDHLLNPYLISSPRIIPSILNIYSKYIYPRASFHASGFFLYTFYSWPPPYLFSLIQFTYV